MIYHKLHLSRMSGGADGQEVFDDVWALDLRSNTWEKQSVT